MNGAAEQLGIVRMNFLETITRVEVQHQMRCFASEDCLEGIHAFFEKRAPKFEGH